MVQKGSPKKITVLYPLTNIERKNESVKKRVAAYCRVSSHSDEQLDSYFAQISYYESMIKSNSAYDFAGIYADEGISGTSIKNRDSFMRMLRDARDGHIDMIITKNISRFGRNTLDCLKSIRELRMLNVDVYFEKENLHSLAKEGELLLSLLAALAQQEIISHSENVKWGKRRKFEKGDIGSIAWHNITGYSKNKKGEVVIIEEQAAIIRRIYKEFLAGNGTNRIADKLNEEKIPLIRGKKWMTSHIQVLLTHEKYSGDTLFQRQITPDPMNKRQVKNQGQVPQYYCKDSHPAIVDKEIWDCVQLEIELRKSYCEEHSVTRYQSFKYKDTLPLTGKIICGHCNHSFVIKVSNRLIDKGTAYYECSMNRTGYRQPKKAGCDCINQTRLNRDDPKQIFVDAWNHLVENKELYEAEWLGVIERRDILKAYRAKELMRLVGEVGVIEELSYELMIQVLSHIEVGVDGQIRVIFLSGTEVVATTP